ncbi:hypothetical protein D9M69_728650 [compost metagenome]
MDLQFIGFCLKCISFPDQGFHLPCAEIVFEDFLVNIHLQGGIIHRDKRPDLAHGHHAQYQPGLNIRRKIQ